MTHHILARILVVAQQFALCHSLAVVIMTVVLAALLVVLQLRIEPLALALRLKIIKMLR
jgi:hypothetical protein